MKIALQQGEFEKMAAAWVYENLVEKTMSSADIVDGTIELEVFGDGDAPHTPTILPDPPPLKEIVTEQDN